MKNRDGPDALAHLGSREAKYDCAYDPAVPEAVPNAHADRDYFVKFNDPEFTSLCPRTGQPDIAHPYFLHSGQADRGEQVPEAVPDSAAGTTGPFMRTAST